MTEMGATMAYQAIHMRDYYDIDGLRVEKIKFHGEDAVKVDFTPGFVFGSTTEHSSAKMQASKILKMPYDRMRAIDVTFENERVVSAVYAYRKSTRK
ncbi:hypothetical protein SEA_BIG4_315 [Microbacterium phage Big4]|nr:hypothetical protein SEA_BIG4_315 [Microbacterium phage Big4]